MKQLRCTVSLGARHSQRGNAMLEATLIILPLLALGFALVDFSLALFVQNMLRNAAREGVRFAITQQTGAQGQDAAIVSVVQNKALGFLPATSDVSVSYLNPTTQQTVTGVGSNASGNICIVSVTSSPWTWIAPLWRGAGSIRFIATSSDVMESAPNGVLPSR